VQAAAGYRVEDVSNISTQRASQIHNKFSNQMAKSPQGMGTTIERMPMSPLSANPNLDDINPSVELSQT
jgi:hypothetical protein